ncbi:MAG: hypothetical protein KAS64_02900 [Spirochaetes bacterium]|nr:hypothetical protein [Spirochaetota bacterium]
MNRLILKLSTSVMIIFLSALSIVSAKNVNESKKSKIYNKKTVFSAKTGRYKYDNKSVNTYFDKKDYNSAFKGIIYLINKKKLSIKLAKAAIKHCSKMQNSLFIKKILEIYPALKTEKGVHSYELLLYFLKKGDYRQFFKSVLLYSDSENNKTKRTLRNVLRFIKKRRYGHATKLLKSLVPASGNKNNRLFNELLTYLYIKTKNYRLALLSAKKTYLTLENIPFPKVKTIFYLALKNKSGLEAVFWGKKILKMKPSFEKNPEFLNNLSMAYIYKSRIDQKNKYRLLFKSIKLAKESIKYKQSPSAFHTLSLAFYESGKTGEAFKYISLARSLKTVNIKYLNFYKLLLIKLKKRN